MRLSRIAACRGPQRLADAGQDRAVPLAEIRPAVHPVVVRHLFMRKAGLFVDPTFTTGLLVLEEQGSAGGLDEHLRRPEYPIRFRWQNDSVAIWGDQATQH